MKKFTFLSIKEDCTGDCEDFCEECCDDTLHEL